MRESDFSGRLLRARAALAQAEAVLIGGGAGLSAAAGIAYGGERFLRYFSDYRDRYGFGDMYEGMFYPFPTQEEIWAHHARHILVNRFEAGETELYRTLKALVSGREYFVVTTNVDGQFTKAGFDRDRIFEVQGDYGYLQCAKGCHDKIYYDEGCVREMVAKTAEFRIPSELIPKCPVCGGAMEVHVRKDAYFVQNRDWYGMQERYSAFLGRYRDRNIVFLELGVGFNTPTIIRFPFESMVYHNAKSVLIRCNRDAPDGFRETKSRTISFPEDMNEVIGAL